MTLPSARQLASEANAFDAELMQRVRARDANALRALYDRHSSMVYGLGLRIVRDPAEAEDLVQDVFLHLWRRAELFDGARGAFLGWLVSLVRNRAIDRLRARRTKEQKTDAYEAERRSDVSPKSVDPNETAYAVSFGVAPATLAFACGLAGGWDALVLIYFVCCGVSRLARYNVTAESLSAGSDKVAYFEGTPIPTSVLLTAILAFAIWHGRIGAEIYGGSWRLLGAELHPLVLLFALSGTLMVSKTLRIPKL